MQGFEINVAFEAILEGVCDRLTDVVFDGLRPEENIGRQEKKQKCESARNNEEAICGKRSELAMRKVSQEDYMIDGKSEKAKPQPNENLVAPDLELLRTGRG